MCQLRSHVNALRRVSLSGQRRTEGFPNGDQWGRKKRVSQRSAASVPRQPSCRTPPALNCENYTMARNSGLIHQRLLKPRRSVSQGGFLPSVKRCWGAQLGSGTGGRGDATHGREPANGLKLCSPLSKPRLAKPLRINNPQHFQRACQPNSSGPLKDRSSPGPGWDGEPQTVTDATDPIYTLVDEQH